MRFDFLDWYNEAYPEDNFDSPADRQRHKQISYNGWLAAMYQYDVKG
jgi:hypothetical protein